MNYKKFRKQRIILTQKSVGDVRRYLVGAAKRGADLYDVLEKLSDRDRKEAEYLSVYDDKISDLFKMSLDMV